MLLTHLFEGFWLAACITALDSRAADEEQKALQPLFGCEGDGGMLAWCANEVGTVRKMARKSTLLAGATHGGTNSQMHGCKAANHV
jgi:hypothetical protein